MKMTPQAEQARRIRADTFAAIAEVREDKSLSDHGRQVKVAELHRAAKTKIVELRDAETSDLQDRRTRLERRLWSTHNKFGGADIISQRDAQDRAEQARTPDEARRLLQLAVRGGDDQLAEAVAKRAVDRMDGGPTSDNWATVFDGWCEHRRSTLSDIDTVVNELADLDAHLGDATARAMSFGLMPDPPEVQQARVADAHSERTGIFSTGVSA